MQTWVGGLWTGGVVVVEGGWGWGGVGGGGGGLAAAVGVPARPQPAAAAASGMPAACGGGRRRSGASQRAERGAQDASQLTLRLWVCSPCPSLAPFGLEVSLEFSVNERSDAPFQSIERRSYEQLLRRLLALPGRPAVIMLHHYGWWEAAGDGLDRGLYYRQPEADLTTLAQVGLGQGRVGRRKAGGPKQRRCFSSPMPQQLSPAASMR